jgi:hypothetical protein
MSPVNFDPEIWRCVNALDVLMEVASHGGTVHVTGTNIQVETPASLPSTLVRRLHLASFSIGRLLSATMDHPWRHRML